VVEELRIPDLDLINRVEQGASAAWTRSYQKATTSFNQSWPVGL
jgi:hypothetical protein